ncbi:hypothetical protein H0H87_006185 [Tephrocybe sp. NHM501043]|nr:hypothetical protein H0H87_006185 [Tephrocybe sp. NHM501043]
MAPTLRSSAPNTPDSKSAGGKGPLSVTPRKAPVCTKCKRPRAGHPRSGCPFTDPATTNVDHTSPFAVSGKALIDALSSMQLQSPTHDQDDSAIIRQRRRSSHALAPTESLVSLDTESQEIVERLLRPGMFDKLIDYDETPEITGKVVQWQESLTPTRSKRSRIKMPGSMASPSPYSSQESIKLEEPALLASPSDAEPVHLDSSTPLITRSTRPPARSMSTEQRETFLKSLSESSGATVCLVSREDIHKQHAEAIKIGFHARIALGKDDRDTQGLLVMGRDEAAVKRLYEQVLVERKKSSGFRVAAGGAVVGAVGAFAGLAFA